MTTVHDLDGSDRRMTRAAAGLLAQSVPADAAGLVPYSLDGYHRYLAAILSPPPALRTAVVRTILRDGEPVAVADWRLLESTLFLNGLAVGAAFRGTGLGRTLVDDGLRLARSLGATQLALDVATGNDAAQALYRRCGFAASTESAWRRLSVGDPDPGHGGARILDWPLFSATYAAYGFADLSIRTAAGRVASVRVVGRTFRLGPRADAGLSPAAVGALTRCPQGYAVDDSADGAFLRFTRMTRPADPAREGRHGDPRRRTG